MYPASENLKCIYFGIVCNITIGLMALDAFFRTSEMD